MVHIKQSWARLRSFLLRRELDREFDEEARSHLELAVDDYIRSGVPEAEARRIARLKFGAVEAAKDAHRDSRGMAWLEGLFRDLRHAGRGLMRDRGFTLTSIVILALVIGLNVAVFAVVNTMLFRGFPLVKDNGRLVYIQERYTLTDGCCLLYADFLAWRDQVRSFRGMAFVGARPVSISDGASGSRDAYPTLITSNTFGLLGVRPALGRDFVPADEIPGAPQVLILPYRDWVMRYGGRADIIGHQFRINNVPATIIGVMPDGFDFPEHGAMWMPLQPTREMIERKADGFFAIGKLSADGTIERARAELDRVNQTLEIAFPASNKGVRATARSFPDFELGPDARLIYGSVWAAAGLVLLIACANLANLTLARTLSRARELSTKIALGAGNWRMTRQLFTESTLLAIVGGGLGWWLGQLALRAWIDATWSRYVVLDYSPGIEIVAWWAAITAATAALFGFIPIVRVLRTEVNTGLKNAARWATMSRGIKQLTAALVAGQMALAIVLLSGAGVLARSLWNIVGAEVGTRGADRVLVGEVQVPREEYPSPAARNAFWDRLQANLRTIPGVETTTLASTIPLGNPGAVPFELDAGRTGAARKPMVTRLAAGPDYFRTLGLAMLAGREFASTDDPGAPPVAIVNQSFVDRYWPGQSAVGRRIGFRGRDTHTRWCSVVGVASNIMQDRPLRDRFVPIVYVSIRQDPSAIAALLVRTRVPADQMAARVRSAIEVSSPGVTLEDYSTLQATLGFDRDRMDLEHSELGKHAAVAPIFGILALLLGSVGLYAVVAHSVGRRTNEIGVRMALGAVPEKIRRLILGEALGPVFAGLFVGLAASLGVNRMLRSQLVGISPYDAPTLSAAALILLLVAVLGCLLPLRRAMRVDPAVALRHD
jgi:predicted permease